MNGRTEVKTLTKITKSNLQSIPGYLHEGKLNKRHEGTGNRSANEIMTDLAWLNYTINFPPRLWAHR